jgi:hypothetical protein
MDSVYAVSDFVRTRGDGFLMKTSNAGAPEILLITPQIEQTVVELRQLLEDQHSVEIHSSNLINVQGDKRGLVSRLRYYWLDPFLTMIRCALRVWRYQLVVTYYHRNGYWLGILGRLFRRRSSSRWVWIGFAPNPPKCGLLGWIKEYITYNALVGHDLIVCNSRPVIDMIKQRYPKVSDRVAYARWGGSGLAFAESVDRGYIFCGGRTNRDFATVLEADFPAHVPEHVSIYRDISSESFERLIQEARIVVMALKRPDISSGQVVLNSAMQSAKPVVVTAIAGIDDYVTSGKDAILVAPGDVNDLKAKLALLLENPEQRKELGTAARLTFENSFNSKAFAGQLFDILTAACHGIWSTRSAD